jgi:hypothetical protein
MRLENNRNKNPFITPEGYFANLNKKITEATCGNETLPKKKGTSIVFRMRWISYAAAIVIIFSIITGVIHTQPINKNATAANSTVSDEILDSEFIDNMLDSYPIDDYTFYCYLTNSDFE